MSLPIKLPAPAYRQVSRDLSLITFPTYYIYEKGVQYAHSWVNSSCPTSSARFHPPLSFYFRNARIRTRACAPPGGAGSTAPCRRLRGSPPSPRRLRHGGAALPRPQLRTLDPPSHTPTSVSTLYIFGRFLKDLIQNGYVGSCWKHDKYYSKSKLPHKTVFKMGFNLFAKGTETKWG